MMSPHGITIDEGASCKTILPAAGIALNVHFNVRLHLSTSVIVQTCVLEVFFCRPVASPVDTGIEIVVFTGQYAA